MVEKTHRLCYNIKKILYIIYQNLKYYLWKILTKLAKEKKKKKKGGALIPLRVAAGILLARAFSAKLAPVLADYGVSSGFSPVLAMALLFLAGVLVVGLAAHILHNLLESAFVGGIDRFLGLLAGLAKGLIFTGVIGYIAIKLVPDMQIVKQSQVLPPLMDFIQALAGSLDLNIPKLR